MSLDNSLRRLGNTVRELEKYATDRENDVKSRQIDLFGGNNARPGVDRNAVVQNLDQSITRIETLLQARS